MPKNENKSNDSIARSNALIESRYSASLLENKLMIWSLKTASLDEHNRLVARTNTAEIIKMTASKKGGGLYRSLKKIAACMVDRTLFMEDPENHKFTFLNIVHKVTYEEGTFEVVFTPEVNDHLFDLRNNFTVMNLSLLEKFTSNHSFRLYEILKVHYYRIPSNNQPILLSYDLSDLKLQLNCVDTQSSRVKEELRKEHPDFDAILEMPGIEKKYKTWYEFKRNVLIPATEEINEKSDMFITFNDVRGGRGGKVQKVNFHIQRNVGQEDLEYPEDIIEIEELNSEEMQRASLIDDVRAALEDIKSLSNQDCIALLKVADNDIDKIKRAYELSKNQSHIKNFVGWMVSCIKNDYEVEIEVIEGSDEHAEEIREFKESYDSNKEAIAQRAWERLKERQDDFEAFAEFVKTSQGLDFVIYDMITSPEEKVKLFTMWIKDQHGVL